MNVREQRHIGSTCGWLVFGLRADQHLAQNEHAGNLDASPLLPTGCASNTHLWVARDHARDFPTTE